EEYERVVALKAEAGRRLKGAASEARRAWALKFAQRRSLSEREAERIAKQALNHVKQALNHVLEAEFELQFDDRELGTRTVAEVLDRPEQYLGETLADPLEGVAYGHGKAKVLRMHNRCLMIHSFAHGGINAAHNLGHFRSLVIEPRPARGP